LVVCMEIRQNAGRDVDFELAAKTACFQTGATELLDGFISRQQARLNPIDALRSCMFPYNLCSRDVVWLGCGMVKTDTRERNRFAPQAAPFQFQDSLDLCELEGEGALNHPASESVI
jgi:hypothetical protein